MEDRKYYITDIESGYKYEVSKEYHEQYLAMWDYYKPKLDPNRKIPIQIYGTGGDMDNSGGSWLEMFKNDNKDEKDKL